SRCSQTCGLVHSIFVTVPVKWTGFFASNSAANAWCARSGAAVAARHAPTIITITVSFVDIVSASCALLPVPFKQPLAWRYLARDVNRHRLAFPVLHQLLLAQMSVQEFFREVDAGIVEELDVGLQPSIDRHRDRPRPCEDVRILDRRFVSQRVG